MITPKSKPCRILTTISMAIAAEPAANAPPANAQDAAIASPVLQPRQSENHPWATAPIAAPKAKRALKAPIILVVEVEMGSRLNCGPLLVCVSFKVIRGELEKPP